MPFFVLLAVVLGLAVCLQGAANGQLSLRIGLPLTLAINSGVVFACSLSWYLIAHFTGRTPVERESAPWYLFTGGAFGLAILSCAAVAYPRLGAGTTVVIAIASQLVTALVLDHFAAAGKQVPFTAVRVLGVVLVGLGTWLVVATSAKE